MNLSEKISDLVPMWSNFLPLRHLWLGAMYDWCRSGMAYLASKLSHLGPIWPNLDVKFDIPCVDLFLCVGISPDCLMFCLHHSILFLIVVQSIICSSAALVYCKLIPQIVEEHNKTVIMYFWNAFSNLALIFLRYKYNYRLFQWYCEIQCNI